jgi:hypothetical protein
MLAFLTSWLTERTATIHYLRKQFHGLLSSEMDVGLKRRNKRRNYMVNASKFNDNITVTVVVVKFDDEDRAGISRKERSMKEKKSSS